WFFTDNDKIYSLISDVTKPKIEGTKINLFDGFMHKKKDYKKYDKEIKNKVEILLSYIKEVLCSENENSFNYIIKWLSNMCKGNKNDSLLYLRGSEGIGKSTLSDFLRKYVLGDKISIKSNSEPLRSPYNKLLCGKLLV